MEIATSRFGLLRINPPDVIRFPEGLIGLAECRDWALLADRQQSATGWLQSIDWPTVALGVASPRHFVPGYQARVARNELALLAIDDMKQVKILVVLGKTDRRMTLNLRAPLVINLQRQLGRQVIAQGDLPVQYELVARNPSLRRIA
jgi:flagellar assembly factor FliW